MKRLLLAVVLLPAMTGESALLYAHNIRTDGKHDDHDLQLAELGAILAETQRLGVSVLGLDEDR